MEQHPVPQHIASYEFRLVGDMTLKQFLQVAGGALVALLFYALPLPGFIKWPFVLVSGLIGTALAFMPIEERPLAAWIVAYIKAIYSPTLYQKLPEYNVDVFAPETSDVAVSAVAVTPGGEKKAEEYLSSLPSQGQIITALEEKEKSFLQHLVSLFPHINIPQAGQEQMQRPRPQIIVEQTEVSSQNTQSITQIKPLAQHFPPLAQTQLQIPDIKKIPVGAVAVPTQPLQTSQPTAQIPTVPPKPVWQTTAQPTTPTSSYNPTQPADQSFVPKPSLNPNVIVGQVVDDVGKSIDLAILEVRDMDGRPTRALRTNKVGHFLTITPLQPGTYTIIVEKDGYEFETVQFTADNNIIKPITIRGRKL